MQADKTAAERLLPIHPAESISLVQVSDLTNAPISDWFETWEPNTSKNLKEYIAYIKAGKFKNRSDSLATLLASKNP
jgi:hypothetical protein